MVFNSSETLTCPQVFRATFTMQDLRKLKGSEFCDGTLYTIISRWKSDGWVEKNGKSWTKKKR